TEHRQCRWDDHAELSRCRFRVGDQQQWGERDSGGLGGSRVSRIPLVNLAQQSPWPHRERTVIFGGPLASDGCSCGHPPRAGRGGRVFGCAVFRADRRHQLHLARPETAVERGLDSAEFVGHDPGGGDQPLPDWQSHRVCKWQRRARSGDRPERDPRSGGAYRPGRDCDLVGGRSARPQPGVAIGLDKWSDRPDGRVRGAE
ncbi:MAG: hypothetical protein ACK55Z_13655, partial [bacterium]